jgi:hypothetical protein
MVAVSKDCSIGTVANGNEAGGNAVHIQEKEYLVATMVKLAFNENEDL